MNDLGFPSMRAESSAIDVATQFGLVSFPFVAILDAKGHVAAINFTGYDLEKTVKNWFNSKVILIVPFCFQRITMAESDRRTI